MTWHGWRISRDESYSIHIGEVPGRKRIALYAEDDESFTVLAYFQNKEAAEEMAAWIERLSALINRDD